MNKFFRLFLIVTLVIAFVAGISKAVKIQSVTGMGDMRGRVVGARLVKDGRSPYYYCWYPGDSMRYFEGAILDSPRVTVKRVSSVTASPAILRAMIPFVEYHEYQIDWGSFILFHCLFMIGIGLALYYTPRKHWHITLLLLIPFVLTDGWYNHTLAIQYYLLFGFLFLLISLLLFNKKEALAGLLLAVLILFRPNAIVFLLPFFIAGFKYRKFILATTTGIIVYAVAALLNPFEKSLWQDYFESLKGHEAIHMRDSGPIVYSKDQFPTLPLLPRTFEGEDYHKLDSLNRIADIKVYPEAASFKQAYKAVVGHNPPKVILQLLLLISVGVIGLRLALVSRKKGKASTPEYKLVIAGLLFYFLSSFFSTIVTASYQFPQWWVMGFLYAIFLPRIPRLALVLFVSGVVFNFYIMPDFKGRHLISEVLVLLSAVWVLFAPDKETSGYTHKHFQ